jgi:hypothetical protein
MQKVPVRDERGPKEETLCFLMRGGIQEQELVNIRPRRLKWTDSVRTPVDSCGWTTVLGMIHVSYGVFSSTLMVGKKRERDGDP